MAAIGELAQLFLAISQADWPRARSSAQEIAEAEERKGHHAAARILRGALASTGPREEQRPNFDAVPTIYAGLPEVLTRLEPYSLLDVQLPTATRRAIQEILREHKYRGRLQEHGLRPRSRLFFFGPPGCGKTLTARAIAAELGLPAFVVRFDGLIGSYLGQTGFRLREVFRFAERTPSVLLVDEIDAVGRRRGKLADIAELDRIVISLMQQLDLLHPAGLLIAASNLPTEIDPALLRRFELAVEFPCPTAKQLRIFAKREAVRRGLTSTETSTGSLRGARTFADVAHRLDMALRSQVLRGL